MHRIFIAINLPEGVKKSLASRIERWEESVPARWMKKENLHIVVEFIGNCSDQEVLDVIDETREKMRSLASFNVKLNKIVYAPPGKAVPQMIWATGDKISELGLVPHITLARIRKWEWQKIDPEERVLIDQDINLEFEVNGVEVMESFLKKGGPEYEILESIPLL